MNQRQTIITVALLSIALVVGAVGLPTVATGRPANQIPVSHMPGEGDALSGPDGAAWSDVETVEIPMSSAPSGLPNAADTSTDSVEVQAARTDSALYVRMRWDDPSRNTSSEAPREFTDAAAMQLPAESGTHPAIALGSQSTPVNVWYWNAQSGTQEIVAGGPGTITTMEGTVSGNAAYDDDSWTVVFTRDLTVEGENRTQIEMQHDVDAAFAVWNGGNDERSGQHAVSSWFHYPLGPEPSGPPFATLLWTIAGIAIVAIVLITAYAVRRTE
jgi:complex iron-sulfur molybdoenzyme family reductase subunit gamma